MHQVKIENRGPEGVTGYKVFRVTEAGHADLQKRMLANAAMADLLTGIELEKVDAVAEFAREPATKPEAKATAKAK